MTMMFACGEKCLGILYDGVMKRMAQVISIVFDPRVEIPILLVLAVIGARQSGAGFLFLSLLLFVDVVLPLGFYMYLHRSGAITDWDIKKRDQRVPLYGFFTLAQLAGVGLAWLFGAVVLTKVLLVYFFLALMFTAVTSMWKVSIHAGVNSALVTYIWAFSGSKGSWMLYALVLVVAWSRVYLGRHQIPQVMVGGLLGALGLLAGMRVVGL